MEIKLVKLSVNDDEKIFDMLKNIDEKENEFTNPVKLMSYNEYKNWLILMDKWDKGQELEPGFVPQTIFWLFDNNIPVGIGKIRHKLTEKTRKLGGNIGYAIDKNYRGRGYATILLKLLIEKAKQLNIEELILTVEKNNDASKRVIEKNGGLLIEETNKQWIFKII